MAIQAHPIPEVLALLNKSKKNETINRLETLLGKIGRSSEFYREFMEVALAEKNETQTQFTNYVMSDRSDAYFNMLNSRLAETLDYLESNPKVVPKFYQMLSSKNGLKMIKILNNLYKNFEDRDCLYTNDIREVLKEGTKLEDSEKMMRYIEVIANISITSQGFKFLESSEESLLNKVLEVYNTEDILLKMNIVQVVSILGEGAESSKVVYEHKIWKQIEKQAMVPFEINVGFKSIVLHQESPPNFAN